MAHVLFVDGAEVAVADGAGRPNGEGGGAVDVVPEISMIPPVLLCGDVEGTGVWADDGARGILCSACGLPIGTLSAVG